MSVGTRCVVRHAGHASRLDVTFSIFVYSTSQFAPSPSGSLRISEVIIVFRRRYSPTQNEACKAIAKQCVIRKSYVRT